MAGNFTSNVKVNNLLFQQPIAKEKLNAGSLKGKIALQIDDRTTVYIRKGKNQAEVVEKYRQHLDNFWKNG